MVTYETHLTSGITRTKEFERKGLACYAVNVGTKCGHGCLYCSTGALLRMHPSFRQHRKNPFETGYAIVEPSTPDRVAHDARRIRRRGMVQLCTTVDAWSPEAQEHNLGRRCLEAILREPGWTVRVLTKNAAVVRDFDLIRAHADRVLVGLSITGTLDKAGIIGAIEPHASPIAERLDAIKEARRQGLRVYGMFCPLLPGIADAPEQLDALIRFAAECDAEEVFVEPANARGPGLRLTQEALTARGLGDEAEAVCRIRRTGGWSHYATRLILNVQRSVREHYDIERLRVLLYPSRLTPADAEQIRRDDAGVVWLGKD